MNKMKTVDLGTLRWYLDERYTHKQFYATLAGIKYNAIKKLSDSSYLAVVGGWGEKPDKTFGSDNNYIIFADDSYNNPVSFKAAMQGVILTYETADSTSEMFINVPIFTYKNATWANTWTDVMNYVNTLKPGTYDIILKATLRQKDARFGSKPDEWGILTTNLAQTRRWIWSTSAQIGDTVEHKTTLTVPSTSFSNFYVYGCGQEGIGQSGKADIELTILNPYMEVIQ